MRVRSMYVPGALLLMLVLVACGGLTQLIPASSPGAVQSIGATPTPTPVDVLPPATSDQPASSTPPNIREILQAEQAWLSTLYERTSQSVVHITSRTYTYDFFLRPVPQEGTGTGFIWDTDGHVVTNYHVVRRAQELEVTLADGTKVAADVIGADPPNDLAVLRLRDVPAGTTLIPLPIGTQELDVGQRVVAIGNPFGFDRTMTTGVISALERVIESDSGSFIGEVIQTDAAINPGNSGGPLLDIDGRVIGVNTAIFSPSGTSAGIGFAIPARTVQRVVPALIANGRYEHPWLGVATFDLRPALARALRGQGVQTPDEGLLIVRVYRGGPAAKAGLQGGDRIFRIGNLELPVGGDVITALDNTPIGTSRELRLTLENEYRVGDTVTVHVVREGEKIEIPVPLGARPQQQ